MNYVNKLDLHGVRHEDVVRIVENFILMNKSKMPLTIIWVNSNKMIELVQAAIKHVGCKTYTPSYGTIVIRDFSWEYHQLPISMLILILKD